MHFFFNPMMLLWRLSCIFLLIYYQKELRVLLRYSAYVYTCQDGDLTKYTGNA